jgi:hypothetical protein
VVSLLRDPCQIPILIDALVAADITNRPIATLELPILLDHSDPHMLFTPIAIFPLVHFIHPALSPIPIFALPPILPLSAFLQRAILSEPVELFCIALSPIAILLSPVVFSWRALSQ